VTLGHLYLDNPSSKPHKNLSAFFLKEKEKEKEKKDRALNIWIEWVSPLCDRLG